MVLEGRVLARLVRVGILAREERAFVKWGYDFNVFVTFLFIFATKL